MQPATSTLPFPAERPRPTAPLLPANTPNGFEAGVSFSLGIAAASWPVAAVLAAAAATLLTRGPAACARVLYRSPAASPRCRKTAWLFVLFCLGWARAASIPSIEKPSRVPRQQKTRDNTGPAFRRTVTGSVKGTVINLPVVRQRRYSRYRDPEKYADFSILEQGSNHPLRVEAEISGGRLPAGLKPGATVGIQGKIHRPSISHPDKQNTPVIHALEGGLSFPPAREIAAVPIGLQLRWKVTCIINQLYSGREHGLFCALITGEKRSLERELRFDFIETGTAHFLAISGLHVGLVMLLAMRIPFPRRAETLLRLFLLCGFVLLSGANTPVLRAALMIGLHLLLKAAARRPRPLHTLGWTLIILLAADPAGISQPGFQLSFIATAAILRWISLREREANRRRLLEIPSRPAAGVKTFLASSAGSIRNGLWIGVISTAATAPLIAEYFHRFHPLAPLLSLCLYPLMALSLILGLISVLLGLVCLYLGELAAQPAALGAHLLCEFLGFARTLPGHCFYLPPPGPALSLLFYLVLGAGMSKKTRKAAVLVSALILPCTLVINLLPAGHKGPVLTHFNTRAGSAALLEIPSSKKAFLIDACGNTSAASQRLVHSVLEAGHRRIDGLFLTHPHSDHAGALPLLAETLELGEIFCSSHFSLDEKGRQLLEGARKRGVPLNTINRGDRLELAAPGEIVLRVIFPCEQEALPLARHANDMSLSFIIESGRRRVLFLGDLEENGLARLFGSGENLRSEVLVLPHHGRTNRLYDLLLEKVQPRVVVVSGDGRGGAKELVLRIEQSGIETYSTWRGGSIRNEWTGSGITTGYLER